LRRLENPEIVKNSQVTKMKYWWLVRENLLTFVKLPLNLPYRLFNVYVPLWLLLLFAVAFIIYLKSKGVKRIVKSVFLIWFTYTVIFAVLTLLILLKLLPVELGEINPQVVILNLFTLPVVLTVLTFANVPGMLEILVDVTPKFFLAYGVMAPTYIISLSVATTALLMVTGIILIVIS
jgi:hypothetical protein